MKGGIESNILSPVVSVGKNNKTKYFLRQFIESVFVSGKILLLKELEPHEQQF